MSSSPGKCLQGTWNDAFPASVQEAASHNRPAAEAVLPGALRLRMRAPVDVWVGAPQAVPGLLLLLLLLLLGWRGSDSAAQAGAGVTRRDGGDLETVAAEQRTPGARPGLLPAARQLGCSPQPTGRGHRDLRGGVS